MWYIWNNLVVSVCIFLIEDLFKGILAIWSSTFVKFLFKSFVYYSIGFF